MRVGARTRRARSIRAVLDPALDRAIRARLRDSKFVPWMGIELVSLDDGASELALVLDEHHLNPGGIAHGGIVATLLDAAIGLALRTRLGMDATHVTVQLHVNYLRPADVGRVVARGTAVHSGSRVGYGEATLLDAADRTLARANGTFMVWKRAGASDGSDGA